ncbi:hypothetical protein N8E89_25450 (plasmid) [Phyllobacterium sp. A18/5-2]|uniref:hypothetical protein n=1 Tax=Phyllobacterium sp. A18/5-2 TaxID=2978392 RepID=UPI0021CA3D47|nr:hypothetical protein [Phyllobacterium sp. A18/5-2]UXN66463.1 hypothetical protein N8E89_25450 [Phyllobacterium sp. A18/5-2]
MTNVYRRNWVLVIFVGLGILASGRQVNATLIAWSTTTSTKLTAGLYASEDLARDWQRVLQLASSQDTFLVSYATGVSHYYPAIKSTDSWIVLPGVLNPKERDQILQSIAAAEIVIEENGDLPADVREALGRMCLTETLVKFKIWQKPNQMGACRST